MLVLGRRCEESIMINGLIEIKILRTGKNRVSLGITAPKDIIVHRKEIWEKISKQKYRENGGSDCGQLDKNFRKEVRVKGI